MSKNLSNHKLFSTDELTVLLSNEGINTWEALVKYVQALPYGRNANRTDFKLLITEQRGTCSSKHAFLKKIADLNHLASIKLILGIYKMNQSNTPKIGNVLHEHSLDYIPEAHCYLKIDGQRTDLTTDESDIATLEADIIQELEIKAEQVAEFKVAYHQAYIKKWILENEMEQDFETIWRVREKCIANLSE